MNQHCLLNYVNQSMISVVKHMSCVMRYTSGKTHVLRDEVYFILLRGVRSLFRMFFFDDSARHGLLTSQSQLCAKHVIWYYSTKVSGIYIDHIHIFCLMEQVCSPLHNLNALYRVIVMTQFLRSNKALFHVHYNK